MLALCVGTAMATAIWLLMLWGQMGKQVPQVQWVEKSYEYKLALAAAVQGPKLVIVGGSAAMFGIDSPSLERALGRPVVNLGVNAGILSPYLQHYARQAIAPGDWVLLPVEYPLFQGRYSINAQFIEYWWSNPGFRHMDISLVQLAQLLWLTPLTRVISGYRGLLPGFQVNGLYGPQHQDEHGDQNYSDISQLSAAMHEGATRSAPETYGAQVQSWNANWASWKALADEVQMSGGCALFIPPPMLDRSEYHRGTEYDYFANLPQQARANGLSYVGFPLDVMYPEDHFFDTNYHLTAQFRMLYTRQVIDWVKSRFDHCQGSMPEYPRPLRPFISSSGLINTN
ncbi:hypothetical protein [Pseudomonas sp.]|uniref:hypothetical protein n=1 Tax=Pseudomonas sp. TaxID=306 RepID=UPI00261B62E2|nr:hypothetical protein [Pseudomonas sp.]